MDFISYSLLTNQTLEERRWKGTKERVDRLLIGSHSQSPLPCNGRSLLVAASLQWSLSLGHRFPATVSLSVTTSLPLSRSQVGHRFPTTLSVVASLQQVGCVNFSA
ncbi:uncharacterized protein LOC122085831 [Macadamia integrifolia]|uniref:uncharacterized protein LOC122085831 n=1 Tax=Macadamia integrifolia TaxID=60698 RepID=UPI001C4F8959|nr:uncharacterized protein LOC122085831 [Macadamia integrifolia]